MPRRRNVLRQALVVGASYLLFQCFSLLPLRVSRAAARRLGRLTLLFPRMYKVGRQNLDLAYGDSISEDEKNRILRGAAENMAIVAAEFTRLPRLRHLPLSETGEVQGLENFDRSRGAFLIGAHLGNWEWMGPLVVRNGFRVAGVVRPLDSPLLNRLVDYTRRSSGAVPIEKDNASGEMIRLLRDGWLVGVLVDQSPRENAVPSTFFGARCWSTVAPVMMAVRARVPIYYCAIIRQPKDNYILRIYPPIELVRTGNLRNDLVENTQRCQDALESVIREHPEQWLWFHRRWKPRPRLEAEWQERMERDRKRAEDAEAGAEPLTTNDRE